MALDDHADIEDLTRALNAIEHDARALTSGLTPEQGLWRPAPGVWTVSECLDHLATANSVYLQAMEDAAAPALRRGSRRRRPALPGVIGGWFVRSLEPPVRARVRMRAPPKIVPRQAPALDDASERFFAAHADVKAFVRRYAAIDLAGVRFVNPFVRGVRFSLATGLHVIVAHDRRHLWQAWNVRRTEARARAAPQPEVR